uniref:3-keto-disaccharide hydrolase n=1 Tax=uncultured Draconibacterium sp. TaxID=1573823 RepID=UPI0032175670
MKSFTFLILLSGIVFLSSCSSDSKDKTNILTKKEISEGWELLFDGKSLDNWKTFNGGKVTGWKIINGELNNSGVGSDHGGDIITKKQYTNFELYLEWKVTPESNSGIFFHVQEGLTNAIYESGPEYQLIDDKGWPTKLEANQYSGANYAMHAPQNAKVAPINEWNTTKIIVDGPHVEHWLNGTKVVDYELWTDKWEAIKAKSKWANAPHYGMGKTGHIGLQDHGGLTMFRNIKIREL